MKIEKRLSEIVNIIDADLDSKGMTRILKIIGATNFPTELLNEIQLYSENLPKAQEMPFTKKQRWLHFLWDILDKLPICTVVPFSIPFRRIIAERLFKKCGENFIAEENVRFNFGQNLEIGNNVLINRNTFLDSKGGITIGDSVGIAENVIVFTHTHSESDHAIRIYNPVVIEDYAKIYTEAMILPGVTIGKEAIVAAKSLVTHNVEPGTLVAGVPAKPTRKRATEGKSDAELNHIWLHNAAFQK